MSLKLTLQETLKSAMKSGNAEEVQIVRLLLSVLQSKELEKRAKGGEPTLTETEIEAALKTEAKKRKEAITLFKEGGREDLKKKEEQELKFIERFLPTQMGAGEIAITVKECFKKDAPKDYASGMKMAMQALKGKADGALVAEEVKKYFEGK